MKDNNILGMFSSPIPLSPPIFLSPFLTPFSQFVKYRSTLSRLKPRESRSPHIIIDPRYKNHDSPQTPKIYVPYPDYEGDEWRRTHRGTFRACLGPRGKYLNESLDDQVGVYEGVPQGMLSLQFPIMKNTNNPRLPCSYFRFS